VRVSAQTDCSDHYLRLLVAVGLFVIIVTVARAAEELPAVTVTGRATPSPTPPGDTEQGLGREVTGGELAYSNVQ
jgi:hypothetical protein